MSKTPRTDEYAGISEDFRGVEVVPADISRELEKRLAEAQAEIKKMMDAVQKMLDIAPEYNNGCGCCSSLSMEQTDEYKALSAIVAENKAAS